MTRQRWYVVGGVVVLLIAMIAIGTDEDVPLDPDGTGPSGARALVLLLESCADEVDVVESTPLPDVDRAVLLDDRLSPAARAQLAGWLRDGGTLVVTDPESPFVPEINDVAIGTFEPLSVRPGQCRVPALANVGDLELDGRVGYPIAPGSRSCFGDATSAFIVVTDVGRGTLVAVGGAGMWTNAGLAEADNSVLAVALLAPSPSVDVAVLRRQLVVPPVTAADGEPADLDGRRDDDERRDDVGGGSTGLFGLMPEYMRWVVVQLALAWLVYAMARARRFGRPVTEPQPVQIPGSEIVRATGRLLRLPPRSETAVLLAESLRVELAHALGLRRDAEAAVVAEVAARRCSLTADQIEAVLVAATAADDADLVALTARIDRIREEVTSVRPTRHE